MKPNVQIATVTGDLGGQKIDMGIDSSAMAHIMSILTDLYSDPMLAVIREYSTNALDSHIEAGVSKPIQVTLPTAIRPTFVVQDFGIGLSIDEITRIYSQYGASTKRGSDDYVGMLGLGCKSGLTYASQFSLVAVKNGVRAHVVVSRKDDGSGIMEIVDTRSTTESNGVTVTVPILSHHAREFTQKAEEFYKFWPAGSVLINGKPNPGHNYDKVTDGLYVKRYQGWYNAEDHVVMGNVAYRLPDRLLFADTYRKFGLLAYVEIGSVDITPSREALMMTAKTKATLAKIQQAYTMSITNQIRDRIAAAQTAKDAFVSFTEWIDILDSIGKAGKTWAPSWRGQEVPRFVHVKGRVLTMAAQRYGMSHDMDITDIENVRFVYGFTGDISSTNKRKMRVWADEQGLNDTGRIVVTDSQIDNVWLGGKVGESWEVVKKTKIVPGTTRGGTVTAGTQRIFGGYDLAYGYRNTGKLRTYREDNKNLVGKTLYYAEADNISNLNIVSPGDGLLVLVHKTRQPNFLKMFPEAIDYMEWRKQEIDNLASNLSDDDILWIVGRDHWNVGHLRGLDPSRFDDPDLANLVRVMKLGKEPEAVTKYRNAIRNLNADPKSFDKVNPLDNYPLIDYGSSQHAEDIYLYANTKYANLKEKK